MALVIAVVGSGGKTTKIHQLTEQYRKEGNKVFVTTTTHMYREEGCILSGNVEEIIQRLNDCGYCMAGMPAEHEKMKVLPPDVYEEICNQMQEYSYFNKGITFIVKNAETGEVKSYLSKNGLIDFVKEKLDL